MLAAAKAPRRRLDPTVALIDVVFQMLVFFMVGGQLAPPIDSDLNLIETATLDQAPPPDALVLHPDGRLTYRGNPAEPEAYVAALPAEDATAVRIIADRAVEATRLIEVAAALRVAGAGSVVLVTEQAMQ